MLANLANDNQFAKILSNQNVLLNYLNVRADVIRHFITAKSLVSLHLPKISPIQYFSTYSTWQH